MGCLEDEATRKKKAMWSYPRVLGHNPPERWGHSVCSSHGSLYIFGGCCGGLHFSDVLKLNLRTMTWTALATTGRGPGPRDSHTAILARNKMIVFGGTNGSHKVNDLHVLDLATREWSMPNYIGTPPSPRESHTATVVGEDKMVIFGGSGYGEANYLNDLHVLDLRTMKWSSPEDVRGDWPVPRDSHSAVAVANKLVVYGGDSGDRYHGDVDVLDMDTFTWSRLLVDGCSPGARAGHASVTMGSKVYVIGGVGDKQYYNDVWFLDIFGSCSWIRLDVEGEQPQGRFSHAAVSTTASDIAIYGGCGEDERPLNELLVLQLGDDDADGAYNISTCNLSCNNHWRTEQRRYLRDGDKDISEPRQSLRFNSDRLHPKRRRMCSSNVWDVKADQEDRSVSLCSKNSSPSRSDRDQVPVHKRLETSMGVPSFHFFKQLRRNHNNTPTFIRQKQEPCGAGAVAAAAAAATQNVQQIPMLYKASDSTASQNLIGANVVGKVDGAFDSGLLMTAVVNGKIFRGVLFSQGPGSGPHSPFMSPVAVAQAAAKPLSPSSEVQTDRRLPTEKESRQVPSPVARLRSDLQGVVLTLGGPGDMHKKD